MTLKYKIPIIRVYTAERFLTKKIFEKQKEVVPRSVLNIEIKKLEKQLDDSIERKKSIEEKAQNNMLGISLGITLIFSSGDYIFNTIKSCPNPTGLILRFVLGAGVLFLITGGFFSLKALRIRFIYLLGIEDEIELSSLSPRKMQQRRKEIVWRSTESNNLANVIQTNAIDESYLFIRLGIFLLGCFIFYLLYSISSIPLPKPF